MELDENSAIKEIQAVFASDNESAIHDSISYIHEYGSYRMLPLLFDLLEHTNRESTKNDIYNCLVDAKDRQATPLFIEALKNQKLQDEKKKILATLWQTNLDFSEHLDLFADILIEEPFDTAMEAYTLIEVCVPNISDEKKHYLHTKIKTALPQTSDDKKDLLKGLLQILE